MLSLDWKGNVTLFFHGAKTVTCSARPQMIRESGPVLRLRSFALANECFLLIRFAAQNMGNDPLLQYGVLFVTVLFISFNVAARRSL